MIQRYFVVCALFLSVASVSANESAQANRLFVEAVKLIQATTTNQNPSEQLPLLEDALTKLNEIVEKHPSTDLAVKLISGQEIGNISLATLSNAIDNLKRQSAEADQAAGREACLQSLDTTDPECAMWLPDIVLTHLMAGNPETALQAAMTTEPGDARDNMLRAIARNYAQAGNLKEASAIVDSMASNDIRLIARRDIDTDLENLVYHHLEKGDIKDALAAAESIEDEDARESAQWQLARAQRQAADQQLRKGDIQGAIAIARQITKAATRNQMLGAIARTQVNAGNLEAAINTTREMEDSSTRNEVLHSIATTQLLAGHPQALTTAKQIQDPAVRDAFLVSVRTYVAQQQLRGGNAQAAFATAQDIEDRLARDAILKIIADTHFQTGNLADALAVAKKIEDAPVRDSVLNDVAWAYTQSGDLPAATSVAESMQDVGNRDYVLDEITRAYWVNGDLDNALATANSIAGIHTREMRLHYVGTAYAERGDIEAASSIAEVLQPGSSRDALLMTIEQYAQ